MKYTARAIGVTIVCAAMAQGRVIHTPQQKCQAGKNGAAATYVGCRANAEKAHVLGGSQVAYQAAILRCQNRLAARWHALEALAIKAGATCPTTSDEATIEALSATHTDRVAWEVSGSPRFVDNADGTISDQMTGLMWEKKVNLGGTPVFANVHDAGNSYHWAGECGNSAGCQIDLQASVTCTAAEVGDALACDICPFTCQIDSNTPGEYTVWTWLNNLNAASFAGHTDWRLPTRVELETIVGRDQTPPAVATAFQGAACGPACTDITNPDCSCTRSNQYWSATVDVSTSPPYTSAWVVSFASTAEDFNDVTTLSPRSGLFAVSAHHASELHRQYTVGLHALRNGVTWGRG